MEKRNQTIVWYNAYGGLQYLYNQTVTNITLDYGHFEGEFIHNGKVEYVATDDLMSNVWHWI